MAERTRVLHRSLASTRSFSLTLGTALATDRMLCEKSRMAGIKPEVRSMPDRMCRPIFDRKDICLLHERMRAAPKHDIGMFVEFVVVIETKLEEFESMFEIFA